MTVKKRSRTAAFCANGYLFCHTLSAVTTEKLDRTGACRREWQTRVIIICEIATELSAVLVLKRSGNTLYF